MSSSDSNTVSTSRREVLGVHPVDGVGQRAQDAELARGREARAVLDVAPLLAVVPVHARDPVLVGTDAGRDRRGAHGRDRRERGDAVVDVDALAARIRASAGARPLAIARSSIVGLHRVDHDEHELLGRWAHGTNRPPASGRVNAGSAGPRTSARRVRGRRSAATAEHETRSSPTGGATTDSAAIRTAEASAISGSADGRRGRRAARGPEPAAAAWRRSRSTAQSDAADQPGPVGVAAAARASPRTTARRARR